MPNKKLENSIKTFTNRTKQKKEPEYLWLLGS